MGGLVLIERRDRVDTDTGILQIQGEESGQQETGALVVPLIAIIDITFMEPEKYPLEPVFFVDNDEN